MHTPMNTSKTTDRSKVKDSSPDMMVKKDEPFTTPKVVTGLSDKDVKAEMPKVDTNKAEMHKAEASKTEMPKGDVYKAETHKIEAPKADIHKSDMPMATEKAAPRK